MAFLDVKTILALTAMMLFAVAGAMSLVMGQQHVSYTHLDVYKRQ